MKTVEKLLDTQWPKTVPKRLFKKQESSLHKLELLSFMIASVLTNSSLTKPWVFVKKEKLENLLIKVTIPMEGELLSIHQEDSQAKAIL